MILNTEEKLHRLYTSQGGKKGSNLSNRGCEATWWEAGGSVTKAEERELQDSV